MRQRWFATGATAVVWLTMRYNLRRRLGLGFRCDFGTEAS
jgi:hypothetical protein